MVGYFGEIKLLLQRQLEKK